MSTIAMPTPDVRADGRSFLAGDSPPVHQIAINAIESETGRLRHSFFSNKGDIYHGLLGMKNGV